MRYPSEHKAETHAKIVRTAANEFRAQGVNGIGVVELMNKVGLTQGGFYAHFKSKDALLDEAIDASFADSLGRLTAVADAALPEERQQAIVNSYLSPLHRDRPDRGCAIAAIGGEVARLEPKLRATFEQRIENMLHLLNPDQSDPAARQESMQVLATMVGALLMSRAVTSPELSDALLQAGREGV